MWQSGRNWSTVIIEVIPPSTEGRTGNQGRWTAGASSGLIARGGTPPPRGGSPFGTPNVGSPMPWALGRSPTTPGFLGGPGMLGEDDDDERDEEDEKIVQVPIFVRVEYEAEVGMETGDVGDVGDVGGGEGKKEKKEHAHWCVLYLGKIGNGGPTAASGGSTPGTPVGGASSGMGIVGVGLRDAGGSGPLRVMGRVAPGLSSSKGGSGSGRER